MKFFERRVGAETSARRTATVLALIASAAAALVTALPAGAAAAVPAHNRPTVNCMNGGQMMADLPTSVSTIYRSEPVAVRFHLLKNVNGVWRYQLADDHYYTNYATFGGALNGGWLPDGNSSIWGAYQADFSIGVAGEYRIAMEMRWQYTGAYTYEWAGVHVFSDPWNFIHVERHSCLYGSPSGAHSVARRAPRRSAPPPRPPAAARPR